MACYAMSPDPGTPLSVIQGEYREMPGMRLTRPQFQRLWRLNDFECNRAISTLISVGFLAEDGHGRLHSVLDTCA